MQRSLLVWTAVLGVALSGFFDGILLHQVLQWHHLLSLVPGTDDLRFQVLWDGYFHLLMYGIAGLALWRMWRGRAGGATGRQVTGAVLVGFGLWNLVDVGLFHWLLGIHRVRLDSPDPLLWDLTWLVALGLVPLTVGWALLRKPGGGLKGRFGAARVGVLAALTVGAGGWALQPPPDQPFATVVFRPGLAPEAAFGALAEAGGRLVWSDAKMGLVIAELPAEGRWRLYGNGAMLVSGTALPAGCFDWSRPAGA